jgi:hypothetical protein
MRRFLPRLLLITGLLSLSPREARARLCGGASIGEALLQADLIVKASVVATIPSFASGGDSRSILKVERVIKGSALLPIVSPHHFICGSDQQYSLQWKGPVLAFIDSRGKLVGESAIWPVVAGAASESKELRAVIREEFISALSSSDRHVARAAVQVLADLEGEAIAPALRETKSTDFGTRFRVLSWLTRFGDPDAFDELAGIALAEPFNKDRPMSWTYNEKEEPMMTAYSDLGNTLSAFGSRSFDGSTAPTGAPRRFVSTMSKLAESKNKSIRRGAIHALRGFNDRQSFPIFMAALDDPDAYVRYDAMFTLCMAMKDPGMGCPATSLFKRDEQKYISRVRAWGQKL